MRGKSDVLAITTPWAEFRALRPGDLKQTGVTPVLLDCWRLLDRQAFRVSAEYLTLGCTPESSAEAARVQFEGVEPRADSSQFGNAAEPRPHSRLGEPGSGCKGSIENIH